MLVTFMATKRDQECYNYAPKLALEVELELLESEFLELELSELGLELLEKIGTGVWCVLGVPVSRVFSQSCSWDP